ncbi:MAG: CDP-diacylglycerol--serine O-phosphatidyltransferase [Rhodobacteraceae bacterium]|nr:CDP-diacylglycerol--serine O-phosphatidyltransferase [Paracoccaceae bacterium]
MDAPHKPRKRELPIAQLVPNLMTIGAACAGLSAIRFGIDGEFKIAVQLILLACVLDGLDGRVARMLKSESAIGAELDSLADFLNFGVVPALLIYLWAFGEIPNGGWIAAVIYAVCCLLRLARFNIGNKAVEDAGPTEYFEGVPSPMGALLALLPMFISFVWSKAPAMPPPVIAIYMIGVGLLMISRLPTWSLKSMTIYRENVKLLVIGFVLTVALLLSYPWATLVALDLAYLAGIAWAWWRLKSRKRSGGS